MALIVTCECGERLEAADDQAGQQLPCPACGKMLELPQPYNPLSLAKYLPTAEPAPQEEVRDERPECPACAGSGHCPHCHGSGSLKQPLLERLTAGISNAVTGVFTALGDLLGAGPAEGRKVMTRSDRRRASGCPMCEASGKCFKCEGSGRFSE